MNNSLIAGAALAALTSASVMAADMPLKAPPTAAMYSWTGCYIGANVGGGWIDHSNTHGDPLPDPVTFQVSPLNIDTRGRGVIGGGQAGCNWQASPNFVAGVEGDFSWSGVRQHGSLAPVPSFPPGNFNFPFQGSVATATNSIHWLSTIRGRLGMAADRVLIYATGGVAFAEVNSSANVSFPTGNNNPGALTSTKTGWVAGAGLEYALTSNWILRGEYLFHRFDGDAFTAPNIGNGPPFGFRYTTGSINLNVARIGASYRFGGP